MQGALHDVANALTVVLGWLDVATERELPRDELANAIERARSRCLHGRVIALRAMGTDVGEELHDAPTACDVFVHEVSAGLKPHAKRHDVSVRVVTGAGLEHVGVHAPTRALQVLTNLLINAVSFSGRDTQVTFEATATQNGWLRFVVTDQGPGFDDARAQRVFEGLASTREGGSGIGLRYAHAVARREGGQLRLLHAGPGAAFELSWPTARIATVRPPMSSSAGLEGMRVLVVEDDEAVTMLLETALGARGASVAAANDLAGLTTLLDGAPFDAALVDLSPLEPDIAGALARIRSSASHPRLVLITGAARPPDREVLGLASAWVRKPFEIADVVAALLDDPA